MIITINTENPTPARLLGDYWVRNAAGMWLNLDGGTSHIEWSDLPAVRVLSEGVPRPKGGA